MQGFVDADRAARAQADSVTAPAGASHEKELEDALRERDEADEFIDTLLDEVLGADRAEWSSVYGRAEALEEVRERITALHKPAVDRAWAQFETATRQVGERVTVAVGSQEFDLADTGARFTTADMATACGQAFREGRAAPTQPAQAADSQPAPTVGTIAHVGTGKTTLTGAITSALRAASTEADSQPTTEKLCLLDEFEKVLDALRDWNNLDDLVWIQYRERILRPAIAQARMVARAPADSVLEDADPIRALIAEHAAILDQNESAYFELCYHRATG